MNKQLFHKLISKPQIQIPFPARAETKRYSRSSSELIALIYFASAKARFRPITFHLFPFCFTKPTMTNLAGPFPLNILLGNSPFSGPSDFY